MKTTAVEWLQAGLESIMTHEQQMQAIGLFKQAKAMEREQKEDMLIDIDIDLALIEDSAKGELGNNIAELRNKIVKLLNL